jgi:type IV secretory pathway VirB2 component (pilin)
MMSQQLIKASGRSRTPGCLRAFSLLFACGVSAALASVPAVAIAGPGGSAPLVGFGQSVLAFLTGTMGPIIVGIGIAIAAISLVVGSRDGLQKAIWAIVGGALLFGVDTVVSFLAANS